ncbi:MAG TPA: DUF3488 and transglutaminase-like domain-containing protein [Tepidisphaeraceae bacterium]|nr:DUF3488 and transglutaminase-like domain-containing protein [Tepidisphaeraceae bacterium]
MYDIRQFKPALYLLLFLGISGFALAAQWPGVWVLAVGGIALNAWLVKTGRFTPMPRFLANIVTIIAFIYIGDLVLHSVTTPILIIGQFLVLLQLVKLYEQRANRDYAQLIILSLLLMVAAAINTASLAFGLMFIAYLFLSLYVCLLFHLKVESEDARKAISLPEIEPSPNMLRQDQRHLPKSMRRLTGLISLVAVCMAVVVFLFFPRGTGANLLGPLQFRPSRALTGFSEQVGFQSVARITQNNELVAHVQVWHNDKPLNGTQSIYLRGLTLDHYNGGNTDGRWRRAPYQWTRMLPQGPEYEVARDGDDRILRDPPFGTDVWRQRITLQPTGSSVLFGMGGPSYIKLFRRGSFVFSGYDDSIQVREPAQVQQPIDYELVSSGQMRYAAVPPELGFPRMRYFRREQREREEAERVAAERAAAGQDRNANAPASAPAAGGGLHPAVGGMVGTLVDRAIGAATAPAAASGAPRGGGGDDAGQAQRNASSDDGELGGRRRRDWGGGGDDDRPRRDIDGAPSPQGWRRPSSNIDPQIAEYVRRPEVSGTGDGGVPLVTLRDRFLERERDRLLKADRDRNVIIDDRFDPLTPYDEAICANIQAHLRSTFTYTLDLTDAKRIEGQDPMVAFLHDLKRGHCEYFAGAMTLMCQSLKMPARMVIGFRCDDFNNVGGYYRVEQSQAHAWVEARGGTTAEPLWVSYDPTSGREDTGVRTQSVWNRIRHVMDYLEHSWAANVIAYDRGTRDNLVQTLENRLTSTAVTSTQQIGKLPSWLRTENWAISSQLLSGLVALAMLALVGAIGWFAWERWRLWRRATRIGLENLPTEERLRLARQLGFYDDLLTLLERRGMARPLHLTPMEFSDSLAFLPAEVYHSVRRLTEVFYRIRYGRQQLSPGQREKLDHSIAQIESLLGPSRTA